MTEYGGLGQLHRECKNGWGIWREEKAMGREVGETKRRPGLPVRLYLLAIPICVLAFIALALMDQPQTLLSLLPSKTPASASRMASTRESAAAEALVRRANAALEACYREGSDSALQSVPFSTEMRSQIVQDSAFQHRRGLSPHHIANFTVLKVEPEGTGWSVTTDETWTAADGRASRLRFRYALVPVGAGLKVASMTPLLPEPVREAAR